jgi:hypothetical protein
MVGESLLEYLKTILDISNDTNTVLAGEEVENNIDNPDTPDTRLRKLLSYSEEKPTFSEIERQKIISAIDNIKIIDPACGSGAFPMGILHKLVSILQKLDPENKDWYNHQYQKAIKDTE